MEGTSNATNARTIDQLESPRKSGYALLVRSANGILIPSPDAFVKDRTEGWSYCNSY